MTIEETVNAIISYKNRQTNLLSLTLGAAVPRRVTLLANYRTVERSRVYTSRVRAHAQVIRPVIFKFELFTQPEPLLPALNQVAIMIAVTLAHPDCALDMTGYFNPIRKRF